ncbi:MAG: hypothetical protein E6G97_15940 [Alphaproteobacteria bacterium]|nr:MAG: hypothetical protein E6G97_15940 [Alphaproteobacteria bacterium]
MTYRPRIYCMTLSAIFAAAILVGSVGAFMPYDSVPTQQEQRTLASFPSGAEFAHPTIIPARITAFFSDNFGGRKLLTREYFRVRLKVLRSDLGAGLVLGKEGSLVLNGEIRSSRHLHRIEPQTLEHIRRLLNSWCSYARERGAVFVFVIAPNKTTIHPFLPDYLPISDRPSVIEALQALPLDCPAIKVDLRAPFRRAAANELLYYKWGSHWNEAGGLIMWRAIKQAVEREGPPLSWPNSKLTVTRRPAAPLEDSMWAWFGLPDPEQIMLKQHAFGDIAYDSSAASRPRAKILVFGDSFLLWTGTTPTEIMGRYTLWALSPQDQFEYQTGDLQKDGWVIAAHPPQKQIEIMDAFRPNIVVLEIVERGIDQLIEFSLPAAKGE